MPLMSLKKKKRRNKDFLQENGVSSLLADLFLQEMLEILQAEQIWYQLEIWIYTSKLTMLATE